MPLFNLSRSYPWTYDFLHNELPLIPKDKPRLFAAYKRYIGGDSNVLQKLLRPGYKPRIEVVAMGKYGYAPPGKDEIQLGKTFVMELEAGLGRWHGPRSDPYAPTIFESDVLLLLECVVLHELVHFYRRKSSDRAALNWRSDKGRGYEERIAGRFEIEAYGKICDVQSLGLAKAMPRTAALGR